jgi:hypothetical protein
MYPHFDVSDADAIVDRALIFINCRSSVFCHPVAAAAPISVASGTSTSAPVFTS